MQPQSWLILAIAREPPSGPSSAGPPVRVAAHGAPVEPWSSANELGSSPISIDTASPKWPLVELRGPRAGCSDGRLLPRERRVLQLVVARAAPAHQRVPSCRLASARHRRGRRRRRRRPSRRRRRPSTAASTVAAARPGRLRRRVHRRLAAAIGSVAPAGRLFRLDRDEPEADAARVAAVTDGRSSGTISDAICALRSPSLAIMSLPAGARGTRPALAVAAERARPARRRAPPPPPPVRGGGRAVVAAARCPAATTRAARQDPPDAAAASRRACCRRLRLAPVVHEL